MTHDELIARAARWVRSKRYPIVLSDVRSNALSEQPDVIGFRTTGDTILVECKASRADFRRDAKKYFRRSPSAGMGYFRWYFVAPELADTDMQHIIETPEKWGLAMPGPGKRASVIRDAEPFLERSVMQEHRLLVTALRRATEGWGRRMFGDIAPAAADGDPDPSTAKTIRILRKEVSRLNAVVDRYRKLENLKSVEGDSHANS